MVSEKKTFPSLSSSEQLLEDLQASETKYRNLVETSSDLIWSVDAEGRWTFLNRVATLQIYGYEPEEMLGRPFTNFVPPEQISKDLQTFESIKKGKSYFKYETVHLRKDGNLVHLSFNAIVLKNSQGKVIGSTGTASDITAQKKAALSIKEKANFIIEQRNALLAHSRMDFSDLQSSLKAIIETCSQFLRVERVSCWLFNETRTEIICQDLFTQKDKQHQSGFCLKAKDYPRYFQALEENLLLVCEDARKDLKTSEFEENYLIPHNVYSLMDAPIRLAGKVIGVLCHEHVGKKRIWKEEEQEFATCASGMISIALLISQLRETEQALQKKTTELERSNKSLSEFAYIASHDLQEPLYIITAYLDNIRNQHQNKLDDPLRNLIDRIYNAALRMSQLTHDLLKYARVNIRNKIFEEVNLNDLIQKIWQDLELRAKEAHATLVIEKLPILFADKPQIEQLFINLLSNALKFRSASQSTHIKISSRNISDQWTEISIEDNGIGIEKDYLEKIFKPFQRLHGRKEYEGSGMGLAICQKIIERHQGHIQAYSEEEKGSRLVITLPLHSGEVSL